MRSVSTRLCSQSAHYRFEPRPVAVARGNEKGRVERTIRYIRDAFLAAHSFADPGEPESASDSLSSENKNSDEVVDRDAQDPGRDAQSRGERTILADRFG